MPKLSPSTYSLCLYIAEHTCLVPETEKLPADNQNWARKAMKFRQPNRIEHGKTLRLRQPVRIEFYVTLVGRQSESSTKAPEGSGLEWKTLLCSRLFSARYSLSEYIRSSNPPPPSPQLVDILLFTSLNRYLLSRFTATRVNLDTITTSSNFSDNWKEWKVTALFRNCCTTVFEWKKEIDCISINVISASTIDSIGILMGKFQRVIVGKVG